MDSADPQAQNLPGGNVLFSAGARQTVPAKQFYDYLKQTNRGTQYGHYAC